MAPAQLVVAPPAPSPEPTPRASIAPVGSPAPGPLPTPSPVPASTPPVVAPKIVTDWCSEGLTPLAEDACYVLPESGALHERDLLIYLHGIVPPYPSPQKDRVQGIVKNASKRAGWTALVPRGRRGIGPSKNRDWWAWPTTGEDNANFRGKMIAEWQEHKKKLEAIAGHPFDHTYLAGSSSGAYFVSELACSGAVDMDGFGAISGGFGWGDASRIARVKPRPIYIGYGTNDDASLGSGARALGTMTKSAGWPVRVAPHPLGHGADEVYLDEAFAFWAAQRTEDAGAR